jgi:hypothetical protein
VLRVFLRSLWRNSPVHLSARASLNQDLTCVLFVGIFGTRIDDAAIVVSVGYRFTMPSVDSPCALGRV